MRRLTLLLALLALAPGSAGAQAGRTAASTLRRPLSARAAGMGEAFTAVEGGPASFGYNPAGLSAVKAPELTSLYTNGLVDDRFTFLGYAHPLSWGVATAGLAYYNAGTIDLNLSNGVREKRTAQLDLAAIGGLSVPLPGGFSAGAHLKLLRSELAGEARAAGYALDAGALWKTPLKGLNLAASLLNAGPDMKFESEGDPLPLTARAGVAWAVDLLQSGLSKDQSFAFSKLVATADVVKARDEDAAVSTGLEMAMDLSARSALALRFGYLFGRELDSLTVGLGAREGRFTFDYALGVMKKLQNVHHLGFGVRF